MMFEQIEWPPTCYVQEGANWLSLGRVPVFFVSRREPVDGRLDEESKWDGTIAAFEFDYTEAEFAWIGHAIDYSRYEAAPSSSFDVSFLEKFLARTSPQDMTAEEFEEWKKEVADSFQADRAEAAWRREQERVFDTCVDDARAEIYRALSRGELKAIGWLAFGKAEVSDDGPPGRFVDIDPRKWSLRNFDWEKSTLRCGAEEFLAVQVRSEHLLSLFPRPSMAAETITVLAYPNGLIISDEAQGSVQRAPRSPGRKAKAGGAIRSAVQHYFAHRLKKGDAVKGEALIQEVIDFAAAVFPDDKISRSTAQEYLKAIPSSQETDN